MDISGKFFPIKILHVPEVLNVHVTENDKKIYFIFYFFSSSEKLIFEKENVTF